MRGLRSLDRSERFLFYTGLVMAASEIWKQVDSDFRSRRRKLQLVVLSISALLRSDVSAFASSCCPCFPPPPDLSYLLMDFSLLSGIGAFLDTSGMHYPLPALTCHSYLWHLLLIAVGIFCGLSCHQRSYVAWLFLLCHPVCGSL